MADDKHECHDCGNPADIIFDDLDDASGYKGVIAFCTACWKRRELYWR